MATPYPNEVRLREPGEVEALMKSSLERTIEEYEDRIKSMNKIKDQEKHREKFEEFKLHQRRRIKALASVQQRLNEYRQYAAISDAGVLEDEPHDSKRLSKFMQAAGLPKPYFSWHAHAMISGGDERAAELRMILAEVGIGIDDPHNGCWLPARSRDCGRLPYPKAVPHSRIHRYNYYLWLSIRFLALTTKEQVITRLTRTRTDLLHRTFPEGVMLPKGQWKEPNDNV
ncbi:AHH domain-containing protein [Teredinibacter turnerae]|uniref:AHH domain-containing protein n=1 Tax=Teredinibacter turnerae TaxID=2426 RepID=UPI00040E9A9D|nr:AHH domain-containing protein [Teredinibacter turnerae]